MTFRSAQVMRRLLLVGVATAALPFLLVHDASAGHISPRVIATITGVGSAFQNNFAADVNSITNRVYVSKEMFLQNGSLAVINGETNQVITNIPLSGRPFGVEVDEATSRVFVAEASVGKKVHVIDGVANTLVGGFIAADTPRSLSIDPVRGLLFVTEGSGSAGTIAVHDLSTLALEARIPVAPDPFGVAADSVRGRAYVTHGSGGLVTTIDSATRSVIGTTTTLRNPRVIKVDETSGLAYIQHGNGSQVTVFDGPNGRVLTTLPLNGQMGGIGIDSVHGRLYVSAVDGFGSNTIHVFETVGHIKVAEVPLPLRLGAGDFAVNPVTDRTYALANEDRVLVIGDRSNAAPVAVAGADQTVEPLQFVALNGQGSSDPDGDALRYTWRQLSGPLVLQTTRTAFPSRFFTAPEVNVTTKLTFELVVDDGLLAGDPDTVTITVVVPGFGSLLAESGVPGNGIETAPGLQRAPNETSQAAEHAGMK